MRPTAFISPVWAMPTTMVLKSRGTMRPLMSEMKPLLRKWKISHHTGYWSLGRKPPSTTPMNKPKKIQSVLEKYQGFCFSIQSSAWKAEVSHMGTASAIIPEWKYRKHPIKAAGTGFS